MPNDKSLYLCRCGTSQPKFGFDVAKKPEFCSKCRKKGMIDVYKERKKNAKLCKCGNKPWYGTRASAHEALREKKPTHCKDCKTDKMGLIKPHFCFCGKQANFGYKNSTPTHCKDCKEETMLNLKYEKLKTG